MLDWFIFGKKPKDEVVTQEGYQRSYTIITVLMIFFLILLALSSLWYVAFAAGAARLANQRHNSLIIAALAFMLSPFYYIYYAFTG